MMVTDALTNLNRQRVLDYVGAHRIPAMYEFGHVVQAGGLISHDSDPDESFKRAAGHVVKILKGAKPGDLPVEQPNRYFLVMNVKAATRRGLSIPPSLLLRADEVIQWANAPRFCRIDVQSPSRAMAGRCRSRD